MGDIRTGEENAVSDSTRAYVWKEQTAAVWIDTRFGSTTVFCSGNMLNLEDRFLPCVVLHEGNTASIGAAPLPKCNESYLNINVTPHPSLD